jgi:4a-hydroxytetrahydrobiopterin dehydratase
MAANKSGDLIAMTCVPCEGGVAALKRAEATNLLKKVSGWKLAGGGTRIRKEWVVRNFMAGIEFFRRVADLAEAEDHHPDLHLEGYRRVSIEISTHAIGGLSANDFILAAKIDRLPVKLKSEK